MSTMSPTEWAVLVGFFLLGVLRIVMVLVDAERHRRSEET